jgi:hypothetical protein
MISSFLALLSALPILILHSYGVSKNTRLFLLKDFLSYSQAANNISTLTAVKIHKISLECSKQATELSSGFSTSLEAIQALHIALQEVHLKGKKS